MEYLEDGRLPADEVEACKIIAQASSFVLLEGILYFVDMKHGNWKRVAVPGHLRQWLMEENHRSRLAGHFAEAIGLLSRRWWWPTLYQDCARFCRNCGGVCSGLRCWKEEVFLHCSPSQCSALSSFRSGYHGASNYLAWELLRWCLSGFSQ